MRGIHIEVIDLGRIFAESILHEVCTDHDASKIKEAESFFDNITSKAGGLKYRPDPLLLLGDSLGAYNWETDEIQELRRCQHPDPKMFYHIRAHETTHWTLKPLKRPGVPELVSEAKAIGTKITPDQRKELGMRLNVAYCREELVAELGAQMVTEHLGLMLPQIVEFSNSYVMKYARGLEKLTGDAEPHLAWAKDEAEKAFEHMKSFQ